MGVKEHGEKFMRARFEASAVRLLKNIFRTGLFENPYLDPEVSKNTVGNPEFMKAGYEAQLKSMVLLKNKKHVLPLTEKQNGLCSQAIHPCRKKFPGYGNAGEI